MSFVKLSAAESKDDKEEIRRAWKARLAKYLDHDGASSSSRAKPGTAAVRTLGRAFNGCYAT
jgi:hypothetical protein